MRARIGAGLAGWLAGLLPLVAVNVAGYAGLFAYEETFLAGAVGLFGGLVLGGAIAGTLGGRRGRGIGGAAIAGGVAAALYAAAVIGLMFGTGYFTYAPPLIAEHPLRVSGAVVFCALLLLGIALVAGGLTGRRSAQFSALPSRQGMPAPYSRPRVANGDPRGMAQRLPSGVASRAPRTSGDYRGAQPNREHDAVHAGQRPGGSRGHPDERDPRGRQSGPRWRE